MPFQRVKSKQKLRANRYRKKKNIIKLKKKQIKKKDKKNWNDTQLISRSKIKIMASTQ